jgi:hypothetical protein
MWKSPTAVEELIRSAKQTSGGYLTASQRDHASSERQFSRIDPKQGTNIDRWIDASIEQAQNEGAIRVRFRVWEAGGTRSVASAVYEFSEVGNQPSVRPVREVAPSAQIGAQIAPKTDSTIGAAPLTSFPQTPPSVATLPLIPNSPSPERTFTPQPCTNCQHSAAAAANAQSQAAAAQSNATAYQRRCQELESQIFQLNSNYTTITIQLQAAREQGEIWKSTARRNEESLRQLREKASELHQQHCDNEKLKAENQAFRKEIEQLHAKNHGLIQRVREQAEELAEYERQAEQLLETIRGFEDL